MAVSFNEEIHGLRDLVRQSRRCEPGKAFNSVCWPLIGLVLASTGYSESRNDDTLPPHFATRLNSFALGAGVAHPAEKTPTLELVGWREASRG